MLSHVEDARTGNTVLPQQRERLVQHGENQFVLTVDCHCLIDLGELRLVSNIDNAFES